MKYIGELGGHKDFEGSQGRHDNCLILCQICIMHGGMSVSLAALIKMHHPLAFCHENGVVNVKRTPPLGDRKQTSIPHFDSQNKHQFTRPISKFINKLTVTSTFIIKK